MTLKSDISLRDINEKKKEMTDRIKMSCFSDGVIGEITSSTLLIFEISHDKLEPKANIHTRGIFLCCHCDLNARLQTVAVRSLKVVRGKAEGFHLPTVY